MSLLKPTPGEVIDRLSIVKLKIEACMRAGMDTDRLSLESTQLREYVGDFTTPPALAKLSVQLFQTNLKLWKAEDAVRIPNANYENVASAAKCITRLNDRRCSLIRQIDKACGVDTIEEKIYR